MMNSNFVKDIHLYKRLLSYLKPHKRRFIIAMLISLPAGAMQGVFTYLVGPFTDQLLHKQNYTTLYLVPIAIMAAVLIQVVCDYINDYNTGYIGNSITQSFRSILFKKLGSMDLTYFKQNIWNEICSRYCIDPAQLQSTVNDNLQDLMEKLVTVIALTGVLFYRNWLYAIISLVILSIMIIPLNIISKKIRRMDYVTREISVRLFSIMQEMAQGVKIVKVFNLVKYQEVKYERCLRDLFAASMRIMKAGIILKPLMSIIGAFGICIVFTIGVYQITRHQMTLGDLTSFIVALVLLISPIKTVGSAISKMQRIFAPAERVFEKMDLEPFLKESPHSIELPTNEFKQIEFKNVFFEYEENKPVLKDISFTVQAGETIALVGPSGGGKSTLVDLIPRFMDPQQGQILMNGHDLKMLSHKSIYSLMAIVSQDAILFNTTIKENVLLGRLSASDDEVREAMDMAYMTEWVSSLELGWDTPVGELGCFLSGGQKQRVTIARAFLKNAPILILDEATSALDNESEAIVQRALIQLLRNRTVFVIAHRLSTIKHANRIMVLQKGQIIESGSHDELLHHEGLYHKLYHLQFKRDDVLGEDLSDTADLHGVIA